MIKRAWLVTDTHFGLKNFNLEWYDVQMNFFQKQFIPHIKKNYREGDILIHIGDVFDHRRILDIGMMNGVISLFEEFSSMFKDGVYVVTGNHDIYKKSSNDVNSLKCLKYIPNINIVETDPLILDTVYDQRLAFMPWNETKEEEIEDLESINHADYLFCHTNVEGMRFNKYVEIKEGNGLNSFKAFRKVYSGHIHLSQKKNNVSMLGSPYEMDKNDVDNKKGFMLLDFSDESETFFENEVSPKHITINIEDIKNVDNIKELVENNYVEVTAPSNLKNTKSINKLNEALQDSKKFELIFINEENIKRLEEKRNLPKVDVNLSNMDITNLCDVYVDATEYKEDTKLKFKSFFKKLYNNRVQV